LLHEIANREASRRTNEQTKAGENIAPFAEVDKTVGLLEQKLRPSWK